MEEQRRLWRQRWLSSINELTSLDLQKKSWLDHNVPNPHWTYVEFISCYVDDLHLDDNYKYVLETGWVSENEYECLKVWHQALDLYEPPFNDVYNHFAILNDQKWVDIVHSGHIAKNYLIKLLDQGEKETLVENILYLR